MNIELRKCISKHIEWCIKFATGVEMEIFAVCVITFEPIKIQTCSSPQNDSLNLSFVKDIKVIGKKLSRYGHKMKGEIKSLVNFVNKKLGIVLEK